MQSEKTLHSAVSEVSKPDPALLAKRRQEAVADATTSCKKAILLAVMGEASPRQAIKARCLQCLGYSRADIRACTSYRCALWQYRPFQSGDEESADG